jgi:hypothetical protein
MKVLLFGNSDTRGEAAPGSSWAETALETAGWAGGVDFYERRFAPVGHRAMALVDGYLDGIEPDVVFIPLSEYAFWAASVEVQIRELFGRRAARVYKRLERAFERLTGGDRRVAAVARESVRGAARRVIGVRPLASPEDVEKTYREAFRRLAQHEGLHVYVVAYPRTPLLDRDAKLAASRARFLEQLRVAATAHHFRWVDGDEAMSARGLSGAECFSRDMVHVSPLGREVVGLALGEALGGSGEDGDLRERERPHGGCRKGLPGSATRASQGFNH